MMKQSLMKLVFQHEVEEQVLEQKEFVWAKIGLAKTLIHTEEYEKIELF